MQARSSFHFDTDIFRRNLNKYTEKAYRLLPILNNPRILDIGCGSGVGTIHLAKLSHGRITAIDIDRNRLNKLNEKAVAEGVSDQIEIINCSLFDLAFPEESFDIIWAEGSIAVIGFKRGISKWRRFLKQQGFLVIHDEATDAAKKLKQAAKGGYSLLSHFFVSEDDWRREYFGPMEKLINEIKEKHPAEWKSAKSIKIGQREIDFFRKYPNRCASICMVLQKL